MRQFDGLTLCFYLPEMDVNELCSIRFASKNLRGKTFLKYEWEKLLVDHPPNHTWHDMIGVMVPIGISEIAIVKHAGVYYYIFEWFY